MANTKKVSGRNTMYALRTPSSDRRYPELIRVSDDELLEFLNGEACPWGVVLRVYTTRTWYGKYLKRPQLVGEFRSIEGLYDFFCGTIYDTPQPPDYLTFVYRLRTNLQSCAVRRMFGLIVTLEYKNSAPQY